MVHGVGRGGVRRRAVRLGAGQGGHTGETRQGLQTLGAVAAGRHAAVWLQASGQRGEGEVALGLMWHGTRVQKTHHLREEKTGEGVIRGDLTIKMKYLRDPAPGLCYK